MRIYSEEDIKESYEDELEIIWCPKCLDAGYQVQLGYKILMPGQKRDVDYENWLECSKCGFLCPTHERPVEEEIKDSTETIESPFESGKFILESIPKRNSATGKRASAKKRGKKIKLHDDPEINELMRIYGERVKVHYDNNP